MGVRTSSEYVNTDEEEGDLRSDNDARDRSANKSNRKKHAQQRSGPRVAKMKSEDRKITSEQLLNEGAMQVAQQFSVNEY